jgi:hypothetical protein
LQFDEVFAQQVLRAEQAVFLAGAEVRERVKSSARAAQARSIGGVVERLAEQRGFAGAARGIAAMPPKATRASRSRRFRCAG